MIGTVLDVAAIAICGAVTLLAKRQPSAALQNTVKGLLGVATVFVGLRLTVINMGGGLAHIGKQLLIILLSLGVGRLTGRLLRLQKYSNRLGQYAKQKFEEATASNRPRFNDGFLTASLLFCLAPLAILGAVEDGLANAWYVLLVKAVMDGMTTVAFVSIFGASVVAAALPVLAFQGTITLLAKEVVAYLPDPGLISSINAVAGMLIFCVGVVIFGWRKIELTDYLPSLLVAPLMIWIWPTW